MSDETYNGWTNRETWALNLWLSNDQGLYEMTRERVAEEIAERGQNDTPLTQARLAGEVVRCFTEELLDPEEQPMTPESIITMLQDVCSLYRVNWDEIGAAFVESGE
jgi:hypothetical protein